jgi:predicted transcriptional regulator
VLSEFEQECLDVVNEGGYTSCWFVAKRLEKSHMVVFYILEGLVNKGLIKKASEEWRDGKLKATYYVRIKPP